MEGDTRRYVAHACAAFISEGGEASCVNSHVFFRSCIPWASLTVGFVMLIGDQASDQDWVLNLPETKDKGALRFFLLRPIPYEFWRERTIREDKRAQRRNLEPSSHCFASASYSQSLQDAPMPDDWNERDRDSYK